MWRVYSVGGSSGSLTESFFPSKNGTHEDQRSYTYAITEIDKEGIETLPREAVVANASNILNVEIFINIRYISGVVSESKSFNIYKEDAGIFYLLGIGQINTGETEFTLRDIGQPLGSKVLPSSRPEIAPVVFTPQHINIDASDPPSDPNKSLENATVSVQRVDLPISTNDQRNLVVGDKVSFFSKYGAVDSFGNRKIISTGTIDFTIKTITVSDEGVITISFEENITRLFPHVDTDIENSQIALVEGMMTLLGNNPRLAGQYQGRNVFAATNNGRNTFWLSRIESPGDFSKPSILDDSSPFSFKPRSVEGGNVQSFLDVNGFTIFGSEVIWRLFGNEAGVVTPTQINVREISNFGSSELQALKVGVSSIVEQNDGGVIRLVGPEGFSQENASSDISLFSAHLFKNMRITSWTFLKRPVPMVWAVRDDGRLLSLTLDLAQNITAWCQHDMRWQLGGELLTALDVRVIDSEVYVAAIRNGKIVIMKLGDRFGEFPVTDNAFIFEARVTFSSNYRGYEHLDEFQEPPSSGDFFSTVTVRAEANFNRNFPEGKTIGNYIFYERDGEYWADEIVSMDSDALTVTVRKRVQRTDPIESGRILIGANFMDNPDIFAAGASGDVDYQVSVVGDSELVHSALELNTGTSPDSLLFARGYRRLEIGSPIVHDVETLDVELTGPTISQTYKKITEVNMYVDSTRGLYVGNLKPSEDGSVEGLALIRPDRKWENDGVLESSEGIVSVVIDPTWNSSGSIFIRQIDPLPFAIYSIVPSGSIPSPGSGGTGG